jgi:Mce-associated membrane protein
MTDADAPAARSVSVRTLALGIGVLLVAGAIAVAVLQVGRVRDLEDDLDARDAVSAAASAFGEVYLSYDFDDPDRSGDRVLELITPTFAEDFESTRAPAIEELFSNLGTTTAAETRSVFIGKITDDVAEALVVVDVTATSDASGTQQLSNLTFLLDLVQVDGRWLVDDVLPAPQPDITGDNVEAPTTTTTAAP